jgi:hypothetical protein
MRSSLLHPLTERPPRRQRPKRQAEHRVNRLPVLAHKREAKSAISAPISPQPRDIAVQRVRASGGPLDQASYACQCGYLFAAPVTTTVACPHCGAGQAW